MNKLAVYLILVLSVVMTMLSAWDQRPVCPWKFLGGVIIWIILLVGVVGTLSMLIEK